MRNFEQTLFLRYCLALGLTKISLQVQTLDNLKVFDGLLNSRVNVKCNMSSFLSYKAPSIISQSQVKRKHHFYCVI